MITNNKNSNKYKIIFFQTNIDNAISSRIKNTFSPSENHITVSFINNTGSLINQSGNKIIITSIKHLKRNIISICNNSPVILISDTSSRLMYKKIIQKGYYDLLNINTKEFEKKIIASISSAIAKYDSFIQKNIIEKGLYFANVIHELRSPLNSVIGYTSILGENEQDPIKKNNIKIIYDSSKYMLNIINDTLDFTKLQSGKLEINEIQFILKNTIEYITNIFKIRAVQKNITFNLIYSNTCPVIVEGDEFRFTQVILNLLSNAFKFTPENGTITFQCDYNDNALTLKISDTGAGIESHDLDRIFLPFEQSSNKIAQAYGGTGLGLAITKELIQLMKGTISVSSIKNTGTSFTITIPFRIVNETDTVASLDKDEEMIFRWLNKMGTNPRLRTLILEAIKNLPERINILNNAIIANNIDEIKFNVHKLKGFTGSYGFTELYDVIKLFDKDCKEVITPKETFGQYINKINAILHVIPDKYLNYKTESFHNEVIIENTIKILYIDDLPENRNLFAYYINILKLNCDLAEGKNDSIALVKKNKYDIILLDLQMPDISGFDLLTILKKMVPCAYFIAATGDTDRFILSKIKYSGFNSHLFKPFNEINLKNELISYTKFTKQHPNNLLE
ncbi:MAG TPA: hypothetical protein DDY71_05150 [Spirochaetia bacterium]|nr:hypothetical protein [Spirochaetia bacterium]